MSFKEVNGFALFFIATFILIAIYIAILAFVFALTTLSNWFILLVIAWFFGGLYGLIMAIWALLEWTA